MDFKLTEEQIMLQTMVKKFTQDQVEPIVNEVIAKALRLHGCYGYTKEFKVERSYRAQPGNAVISVSSYNNMNNSEILGLTFVKFFIIQGALS